MDRRITVKANGRWARYVTDEPTVFQAWSSVMHDIQSIEKGEFNKAQGFRFRGIDAVIDVVGPALRRHGVVVVPSVADHEATQYETRGKDGRSGTMMVNRVVRTLFTVYGPAGDSFTGVCYGEAADAGDKAATKAQSVALRTFLLQALMVPTGDQDPDAYSHERAAPQSVSPLAVKKKELWTLLQNNGIAPVEAIERFASVHGGELKDTQDLAAVEEMVAHYKCIGGET